MERKGMFCNVAAPELIADLVRNVIVDEKDSELMAAKVEDMLNGQTELNLDYADLAAFFKEPSNFFTISFPVGKRMDEGEKILYDVYREKCQNLKAALLYVEGDILLSELVCVTDSLSDAVGRDAFLNADLLLAMSAQKKEEGTGRLFMWFR